MKEKSCLGCSEADRTTKIPYVVHEASMTRVERIIKKLWVLIILLVVLLVGTNAAWLWYESSFEDIVITQENEAGYNSFIGNDGEITYGETNN